MTDILAQIAAQTGNQRAVPLPPINGAPDVLAAHSPHGDAGYVLLLQEQGIVFITTRLLWMKRATRGTSRSLAFNIGTGSVVDASKLRDGLAEGGVITSHINRIMAGHTIVMTSDDRLAVELSDDARLAADQLEAILGSEYYDVDGYVITSVANYLRGRHDDVCGELGVDVDSTDDEIEEVAKALVADALVDRVVISRAEAITHLYELIAA